MNNKFILLIAIVVGVHAVRAFGFGTPVTDFFNYQPIWLALKNFMFLIGSTAAWWFFIVNDKGAKGTMMENITQYEAKMRWQRMTNENAKPPVDWNANRKNSKGWLARDSEGTEFFAIKEDDLKKKKK